MRRVGSTKFWAWGLSILLHLVVLAVFSIVNFSNSKAYAAQRPIPVAKVIQVQRMLEATPLLPKPKIKRFAEASFSKTDKSLFAAEIFPDKDRGDGPEESGWRRG